jgi:hypothetical protein
MGIGYNDSSNFMASSVKDIICTSSAQNDSGMFELNFGDERYLPFENAGVISDWTLEFTGHNQLDLSTVSDVILHINYTAEHSENVKVGAEANLDVVLPKQGSIIFSPKQEFPDEWNNLSEENSKVNFEIKAENIPFYLRGDASLLNMEKVIFVLTSKKELYGLNIELKKGIASFGNTTLEEPSETYEGALKTGDIYVYSCELNCENSPKAVYSYTFDFDFSETTDISASDIEECVVAITLTK